MKLKCKHEWIAADDGSRDKICTKCLKRAMQGVMYHAAQPIMSPITPNLTQPILRETIVIHTGASNLGNVTVYKDDVLREIQKAFSLPKNYLT